MWGRKPDVARPQVQHLLDPRACIEEQREQRIVAASAITCPVDSFQQGLDGGDFQVFGRSLSCAALGRDGDQGLPLSNSLWVTTGEEAG
jgi:hypothetical protein